MFKICVQPTAKIRDFCLNFKKNGKNKVQNMVSNLPGLDPDNSSVFKSKVD